MILKIILDSSLDEDQYKKQGVENQILYCVVKSVREMESEITFILESAFPIVDELYTPIHASVEIGQDIGKRFFVDYGPDDYVDVPCNVEQVDSFPSPITKK